MAISPKTVSEKAGEVLDQGREVAEEAREGLDKQVAALRRELADISGRMQDLADAGWESAGDMADAVTRQGRRAAEAVRENPLPVIAGLATVALLAALVFRRD